MVTQHSGEGKANQYQLRGFQLDHGTDFEITLDGMPLNMPTHGHGQGYADANFLIPELFSYIIAKKGPYFADEGDFSSAGAVHIQYKDELPGGLFSATAGSFDYGRLLGINSDKVAGGNLLSAVELGIYNGPWTVPDRDAQDQRRAALVARARTKTACRSPPWPTPTTGMRRTRSRNAR